MSNNDTPPESVDGAQADATNNKRVQEDDMHPAGQQPASTRDALAVPVTAFRGPGDVIVAQTEGAAPGQPGYHPDGLKAARRIAGEAEGFDGEDFDRVVELLDASSLSPLSVYCADESAEVARFHVDLEAGEIVGVELQADYLDDAQDPHRFGYTTHVTRDLGAGR